MKIITEDGEIRDANGNDCDECTVFFKTPYNHNRNAESDRTGTYCTEPSLTDQSFKEDADINTIMERYGKGATPNVVLPEHFGDAFAIPTLLEARTRIAESNATFHRLPAKIREEFLNDPGRWEERVAQDIAQGDIDNLERMGINMTEVRERIDTLQTNLAEQQASQDEKQLTELQERLAKRAAATQGATPAPGNPKGQGGD